MLIFLCRISWSGATRSRSLSECFHSLWINAPWAHPSSLNPPEYFQWPTRKHVLCPERIRSLTNITRSTRISFLIASLAFCRFSCVAYQNGLHEIPQNGLQRDTLQVPQKIQTVLVWYLLLRIRILVYSWTGCGISKMYLCLKDNRSLFFGVSLKFKTKDARPQTAVSFFLGKQKLDVKQLKINKFIFDIKPLKMKNL